MNKEIRKQVKTKMVVRKCHVCSHVNESQTELEKCKKCAKSFLPLNYFDKIHDHEQSRFTELFAQSHEITDDDLIKGLFVLW